jgi:ubiquinone/menaquinone biosynthesis C-methylase UbiE
MTAAARSFDRLARHYHALESLAFGRDLTRARFQHLDLLQHSTDILVLGEGDGRCLARLVGIARQARIHCVDASASMLERASGRLSAEQRRRVTFTCSDALSVELPHSAYDAVTTLFFLDCFTDSEIRALVPRIRRSLRSECLWLFADFAIPQAGWRRWRAQLWLTMLYAFFRWQTGLSARGLPKAEDAIVKAGFVPASTLVLQHGLLRSVAYRSAG